MTFLIAVAPWVILILITSLIWKKIYDHYVYSQTMYANGCSSPPRYQHRDPILGLDLFIKPMRYMKEGNYFDLCQTIFREYGKTYTSKSWGRTVVHTMDPKNMQVVLSSCSSHFAVEPFRLDALERLLGNGVFISDGYNWEHSRGLINPIFAKAYISDLSSLDLYVTRVLDLIPRDRSTVDLQPLFKRLVRRSMAVTEIRLMTDNSSSIYRPTSFLGLLTHLLQVLQISQRQTNFLGHSKRLCEV